MRRAAFDSAAEIAVAADDSVEAAICFRGAAWVDRHAPIMKLTNEGPARSAYRLEKSTASPAAAPRATLHGLLDQADHSLLGRKWREAWRPAARALRMGFDDIDPGGVERAEERLAKVWLGAIGGAPEDEYSLFWTAHFAARARPGVPDTDAKLWVQPLVAALSPRTKPLVLAGIVRHLANDSNGRSEMAGAMLLLADIAPTIDDSSLSNHVVPLIIAGLQGGWGMNWLSNPSGAACRLLEAVQLRLSPSDAERIRAAVAETLPSTPLRRREEIYIALAQAVAAAPPLPNGGADLASDLLAALEQTRRSPSTPHYMEALHLSLAAVAEKGNEATRNRITEMFDRESHSHRWYGFSILSARHISLKTEVIDRYIEATTERIRALTVKASPQSFALSFADDTRLTAYGATHASRRVRDAAITAGLDLIANDEQWSLERASWVPFVTRLLVAAPERVSASLFVIARLAKGEYSEPGDLSPFVGNHPLSAFRINLGSGTNLRARALAALGDLWTTMSDPERNSMKAILVDGLRDSNPAVRLGAVVGITSSVGQRPEMATEWQRDALISALRDSDEEVRNAVIDGLTSVVAPPHESAQEAQGGDNRE
jgi:hypothetical protein